MSMQIFIIAMIAFLFVIVTERHKSIRKSSGKTLVATLLISLGVIAEMQNLFGASQLSHYNMDRLYLFIKDIAYSFGISSSSLTSFYFVSFSILAIFVLIFSECKFVPGLLCQTICVGQTNNETFKKDESNQKALRQLCICQKMRN